MSETEAYTKVGTLRPDLRGVNVLVKVVGKEEPRIVISRRDGSEHRVAEALVGDETGSVLLTLWNDQIDKFEVGDVLEIRNGFTSLFRTSLRLNIGRRGIAEKVDKEIETVNTENNLSERTYEERRGPFRRRGFR